MPFSEIFDRSVHDHLEAVHALTEIRPELEKAAEALVSAIAGGKKILFCGNGGSAADAQHLAAELVGRFQRERRAIPALALHTDTSALTAIGNDYSFDEVYARQVEAHGREGDVLVAISTSGNSESILRAIQKSREIGVTVVALTGRTGGKLKPLCDLWLGVPSDVTARIQECHILIGHCFCEAIEAAL